MSAALNLPVADVMNSLASPPLVGLTLPATGDNPFDCLKQCFY